MFKNKEETETTMIGRIIQGDTKSPIHTTEVMGKEESKQTTDRDKPTMTTKTLATNI